MRYHATVSEVDDGIYVKVTAFGDREQVLLDRLSASVTGALQTFQRDNPAIPSEIFRQLTASVCHHYASLIQQNLNELPSTADPKNKVAEIQAGAAIAISMGLTFASRQLKFPEMAHCTALKCVNAQLGLCMDDHKAIIRLETEKRAAEEQRQRTVDANFDVCNRTLITILTAALSKYEADHKKSLFKPKGGGNKKIAGTQAALASIVEMQDRLSPADITARLFALMGTICAAPGYEQRSFLLKELKADPNNPLKILFPDVSAILERDRQCVEGSRFTQTEKKEMVDGGKIACYSYEVDPEGGVGPFSFDLLKLFRLNQGLLFRYQPTLKAVFNAAVEKYGDALKNGVLPAVMPSATAAAAPGLQQQTVFRQQRPSGSTELGEEMRDVDRRPEDTGPQ